MLFVSRNLLERIPAMLGSINLRKHFFGILLALTCLVWLSNSGTGPHPYQIREVDVSGAKALIDAGALVIDVRGQSQYDARHIPGAILVALEDLRAGIPPKLQAVAKDRQIVLYCNEGLLHGPEGTDILNKAGYSGAVNLKNGIEGWAGQGNPVKKG
jgi:rhodanese-related sulfurtransferase